LESSDVELLSDFEFRISDLVAAAGRAVSYPRPLYRPREDRSTRREPYPELINDDETSRENNRDLNHKGREGRQEIGIRERDIPAFVVGCRSFVPLVFFVVLPDFAATRPASVNGHAPTSMNS
jgi:hypothetical protein